MCKLLKSVRDIYDALALLLQPSDDLEELLALSRCERGSRLVHDEDLRIHRQSLGDLDHLLLGNRKVSDDLARRYVHTQLAQILMGYVLHLRRLQGNRSVQLPAEEHVLCYGQVPAHIQLLVDDRHARFPRELRRQVPVLLIHDPQRSAVSCIYSAQDLHKRGFSCTVLSEKSHHLALAQLEPYIVQCLDAREGLIDVFHRNDNFACAHFDTPELLTILFHIVIIFPPRRIITERRIFDFGVIFTILRFKVLLRYNKKAPEFDMLP